MAGTRLKQKLTNIADSIRCKLPSTALMTLDQMPPNIEDIVTHDIEDALVDRTLDGFYNNPRVTVIGSNCLQSRRITGCKFENVETVGGSGLYGCSSLETAEFPKVSRINEQAFRACNSLSLLNLYDPNRTEIPILANSNALSGTAIASGNGYIVINDNLVLDLQQANNWSTYSNQIIGYSTAIQMGLIEGASAESAEVPAPAPLQTIPVNRLDIDKELEKEILDRDLDPDLDPDLENERN